MSSQSDLDLVERVWKNGVSDYLVTPYDPIILERKVARLLSDVPRTPDEDDANGGEEEESIEPVSEENIAEPVAMNA